MSSLVKLEVAVNPGGVHGLEHVLTFCAMSMLRARRAERRGLSLWSACMVHGLEDVLAHCVVILRDGYASRPHG